jgi:hypothetical protein
MGEGRNVYRVLVGKPEGKRPLGRPRRRWEGGITMDLWETGWGEGVEWIYLAQDRDGWWAVVNAVMNLRVVVGSNAFSMTSAIKMNFPHAKMSSHIKTSVCANEWKQDVREPHLPIYICPSRETKAVFIDKGVEM